MKTRQAYSVVHTALHGTVMYLARKVREHLVAMQDTLKVLGYLCVKEA
jgi:hypothetical protein